MFFKSKDSKKPTNDESIIIAPEAGSKTSIFNFYWTQSAIAIAVSGLLSFCAPCSLKFLPRLLSFPFHLCLYLGVTSALNFMLVFGLFDIGNFIFFSCYSGVESVVSPFVETTEQVV